MGYKLSGFSVDKHLRKRDYTRVVPITHHTRLLGK